MNIKRISIILFCMIASLIILVNSYASDDNEDHDENTSHGIKGSKHDLSASTGHGPIKSSEEAEICIFCHTPHSGASEAPLWNRYSSGVTYLPYNSTTVKSKPGQPTGDSKLCLSCHDGTIALGMVRSRLDTISMEGGIFRMPGGKANLGNDLTDDHPISFKYNSALAQANGQLRDPITLPDEVHLDKNNELQCTSCHDVHSNKYGKFLVKKNIASSLCTTCHIKDYWDESIHRQSEATWNGNSPNPWTHTKEKTVSANACENCHKPHTAGNKKRLLNFAGEEENCFSCHSGIVASLKINSEFTKQSVHPIAVTSDVHDPTEDAINPTRHVECEDCHNPHAVKKTTATPPDASGALTGVKGVSSEGSVLPSLQYEYELCYRCHADSVTKGAALINRLSQQTNTRIEFNTSNASYHPVESAGKNANVPSLMSPLTESSIIYCTDCHNNDQGPSAGGNGPNGPHGSAWRPLLERRLLLSDNSNESTAIYALCYKCHNRDSILGDDSFKYHRKHIVEAKTSCTTCHDSHASSDNTNLINFNTDYVSPDSNGSLKWIDDGNLKGTCSLTCHGKDHNPKSY